MPKNGEENAGRRRPLIEWIAGGIGLVLTLGLLGFVGWQASRTSETAAPQIDVRVTSIVERPGGYLVEIAAANRAPQTAAGVEIRAAVMRNGRVADSSSATFDYVPGRSEVRGGLFFETDPAVGELKIRALGYRRP